MSRHDIADFDRYSGVESLCEICGKAMRGGQIGSHLSCQARAAAEGDDAEPTLL